MKEYPHIDSVYKRDQHGKFIPGDWSTPEFEYLKDNLWVWTEKIDGTNIRIMWDENGLRFGGKTDNAQLPAKLVNNLDAYGLSEKMAGVFDVGPVCLYGEGYGAGIQKGGGLYSPEQKFILFDVKIGNWWLERDNIEDIAAKLNLDVVPILNLGGQSHAISLSYMIRDMFVFANDPPKSELNPAALVEGYVGQPLVPLSNRKGNRIITKIKYKDFR